MYERHEVSGRVIRFVRISAYGVQRIDCVVEGDGTVASSLEEALFSFGRLVTNDGGTYQVDFRITFPVTVHDGSVIDRSVTADRDVADVSESILESQCGGCVVVDGDVLHVYP